MLWIGIAAHDFQFAADAPRGRIAPSFFVGSCAVNLLQLRVVALRSERLFDRIFDRFQRRSTLLRFQTEALPTPGWLEKSRFSGYDSLTARG